MSLFSCQGFTKAARRLYSSVLDVVDTRIIGAGDSVEIVRAADADLYRNEKVSACQEYTQDRFGGGCKVRRMTTCSYSVMTYTEMFLTLNIYMWFPLPFRFVDLGRSYITGRISSASSRHEYTL